MDPSVETIFESIVKNPDFIKRMEGYIQEIMRDGKVDYHDIPQIVFLVTDTVSELYELEMNEDQLKQLLNALIDYVFERYNLVNASNKFICKKMIESAIRLILLTPLKKSVKGCFACW